MLALLCNAYSLVVLLAVIASWLHLAPEHPLVRVTRPLTEPVLAPTLLDQFSPPKNVKVKLQT